MTHFQSVTSPKRQQGAARTLVLIGVIVLVVLVAAGAGGTFYFMQGDDSKAKQAKQPPPEPTFVTVNPMTVNLSGDSRVLYIGLSLAVAGQKTADKLEAHMPEVRNRMLITLSDKQGDELTSASGKRQIAKTLRKTLRAPYVKDSKPVAIDSVLFTNFIVQ